MLNNHRKKHKGGLIRFLLKIIFMLIIIIVLLILFSKFGPDGNLKDNINGLPFIKEIMEVVEEHGKNEDENNVEEGVNVTITEERILVNSNETTTEELLGVIQELIKDKKVNLIDDGSKHLIYEEVLEMLKGEGYIVVEKTKE